MLKFTKAIMLPKLQTVRRPAYLVKHSEKRRTVLIRKFSFSSVLFEGG